MTKRFSHIRIYKDDKDTLKKLKKQMEIEEGVERLSYGEIIKRTFKPEEIRFRLLKGSKERRK